MIKMNKYIALVAAMFLGGASNAAYLYWQVDKTDAPAIVFQGARVVASDGSSSITLNIVDDYGDTIDSSAVAGGVGAAINLDQLNDASAYSFYVELVNYNASTKTYDVVGTSKANPATYTSLVESNFIDAGGMGLPITPAAVWHGGTSYSVPEPTSAMLVMFGMGLLALKRKRV